MPAPRTHRRSATIWVTAVLGAALVVTSFLSTGLPIAERVLGALFYGGVAAAALGLALRRSNLVSRRERGRWAAQWYDGPYGGGRTAGIAVPVVRAEHGLMPLGSILVGVGLCVTAVYVGVTGRAVEGGTGVRVVVIVLCGLFGLLLLLGGFAERSGPSGAGTGLLLLTADDLYPSPNGRKVPWTAVTGARTRTIAPRSYRVGGRALNERVVVDVFGSGSEPLASIDVSERPDPDTVVDLINAVAAHPQERGCLRTPAGLGWLARFAVQPTGG